MTVPWNETIRLRLTCSFPIGIGQFHENFRSRGELDVDLHFQESVLVLLIKFSLYKKILNMTLDWDSKEGNITKDTCTVELGSPRITRSGTDRTATNDNTEVSMLILSNIN